LSVKVTNEDGSVADVAEHLSSEHRKGTKGFTEEYLAHLHRTLHQRRRDEELPHRHPEEEREEEQPVAV
jgi:DNA polymerase IIIc chi subunit